MAWSDYFWPGTSVLRNKLDVTDPEVLRAAEYEVAAIRHTQIDRGLAPIPETYDAAHLRAAHGWLFQDVYSWAGQYRDVPIAKLTEFAPVDRIDECLTNASDAIAGTDWQQVTDDEFADRAAEVFGWLNYAHPFRDGNGRAARVFMDAVAHKAGRWLDYSAIGSDVWVQRAAFSVPDLDQDRPQHEWLTPVFATIARPSLQDRAESQHIEAGAEALPSEVAGRIREVRERIARRQRQARERGEDIDNGIDEP